MIKCVCDLCGKEVPTPNCLTSRKLQSICPKEEFEVDFCSACYEKYRDSKTQAYISVDMKFLKEMGKV